MHVQQACSKQAMSACLKRASMQLNGHHAPPAKTLAHPELGRWHASAGRLVRDMIWYMPEIMRGLLQLALCCLQQAVLTGWPMHASLTHTGILTSSVLALQRTEADAFRLRALLKQERRDRQDLQQGLLLATAALAGQTHQVRLSVVQPSLPCLGWTGSWLAR